MKGVDSGGGGGGEAAKAPAAKPRPGTPLFLRFAVPKEWRTKDGGTA